jgi:hypothetical protein
MTEKQDANDQFKSREYPAAQWFMMLLIAFAWMWALLPPRI